MAFDPNQPFEVIERPSPPPSNRVRVPTTVYSLGSDVGGPDEIQDKWTNKGYSSKGQNLTPGVVAVNDKRFPLGTVFRDPETGEAFLATDRHGNKDANVVDFFVSPSRYQASKGQRDLEVVGQVDEIPGTVDGVRQLLSQYGALPPGESGVEFLAGNSMPPQTLAAQQPDAATGGGFDPSQPYEIVNEDTGAGGGGFDPSQPYEIVNNAAEFDPSQPFEVVPKTFTDTASDWINQFARGATSDGGIFAMTEGASRMIGQNIRTDEPEASQQPDGTFDTNWMAAFRNSLADTLDTYADDVSVTRKEVRTALPVDPNFQASLAGQIVAGFGQLPASLAAYSIPGMGPLTSAGGIYDEVYQDALAITGDPAKANEAGLKALPGSVLEVMSDKLIIRKILKPLKGKITVGDLAKTMATTAIVGGSTEAGQQAWNNYVARSWAGYDPDRKLDDEVINSFIVGAIVDSTASTAGQAAVSAIANSARANTAAQGTRLADVKLPVETPDQAEINETFGPPPVTPGQQGDERFAPPATTEAAPAQQSTMDRNAGWTPRPAAQQTFTTRRIEPVQTEDVANVFKATRQKLTDEQKAAQEEAKMRAEMERDLRTIGGEQGYELLEALDLAGGLPSKDNPNRSTLTGELDRVLSASRSKVNAGGAAFTGRIFRTDAESLDRTRQVMQDYGFSFETPADMLAAIEDRLTAGRPVYGNPEAVTPFSRTTAPAGIGMDATQARLAELGYTPDGMVRVVDAPGAQWDGRSIFRNGKLVGIEINAATVQDVDAVLEHELAEAANADGALTGLLDSLTTAERASIEDTITRLGYADAVRTREAAARAIEQLVTQFRGRNWFERAVGNVMAWAQSKGLPMTRRAAEAIAARAVAEVDANIRRWNTADALSKLPGARRVQMNGQQAVLIPPSQMELAHSITAYHGTPHKVNQFSLDKIGTGEGAQAYGWGLYFAENPSVASEYRDRLTNDTLILDGVSAMQKRTETGNQIWSHASQYFADGARTREQLLAKLSSARDYEKSRGNRYFDDSQYAEVIDAVSNTNDVAKGNEGNTYTVELDVEPDQLLDWDKPLSEQSDKVREAFSSIEKGRITKWRAFQAKDGGPFRGVNDGERWVVIEEDVEDGMYVGWGGMSYATQAEAQKIANARNTMPQSMDPKGDTMLRMLGYGKEASDKLLAAGIPGIRYLDQGSRGFRQTRWKNDAAKNKYDRPDFIAGIVENYLESSNGNAADALKRLRESPPQQYQIAADAMESGDIIPAPTYNYVIFDESKIRITAENDQDIRESRTQNNLRSDNPSDTTTRMPQDNRADQQSGQPSPGGRVADAAQNTSLKPNDAADIMVASRQIDEWLDNYAVNGWTEAEAANPGIGNVIADILRQVLPRQHDRKLHRGSDSVLGDPPNRPIRSWSFSAESARLFGRDVRTKEGPTQYISFEDIAEARMRRDKKPHYAGMQEEVLVLDESPAPSQGADIRESRTPAEEAADTPAKRRKFIQSVEDARGVAPEVKDMVESIYQPITNKDTIEAAKARINEIGIDRAMAQVLDAPVSTAMVNTMAIELMGRLQAANRFEDAASIAIRTAERATTQGQAIQSLSIMARLTSTGIEYYAHKTITQAIQQSPELARLYAEIHRLREELRLAKLNQANTTLTGTNKSDAAKVVKARVKSRNPGEAGDKITTATMQSLNLKMRDVLLMSNGDKASILKQLQDTIINETGATATEAATLAREVKTKFDAALIKARGQLLNQISKVTAPRDTAKKSKLARLMELNNAGALDDAAFYAGLARMYGVPAWTRELSNQVQALQRQYEGTTDPLTKLYKGAKMLDTIHEVIPSDAYARARALQNIAMLLNPKTLIRNIYGAVMLWVPNLAADAIGMPTDAMVSVVTGTRTRSSLNITARLSGLAQPVRDYWQGYTNVRAEGGSRINAISEGVDMLVTLSRLVAGNKYNETQLNEGTRRVFSTGVMRMLEDTLALGLGAFDRAFHQSGYQESIARKMRLAANRGEELIGPTEAMVEEAMMDAAKAIFQDPNAVSKAMGDIRKALNFGKGFGLGTILIPFTQVPGSILMRGIEWSPFGFINALYQTVRPTLKRDAFNQKEFVDALSRASLGTAGLAMTGYWLAKIGVATALPEEDKDLEAMRRSAGMGQFRINASALKRAMLSGNWKTRQTPQPGDVVVNYDWIQPMAITFAMGAQMATEEETARHDVLKGKSSKLASSFMLSAVAGVRTMEELSLLSGLTDTLRTAGNEGIAAAATDAVLTAPTNFVPTLVNQINAVMDNQARELAAGNPIEQAVNRFASRIPGVASKLAPKYNVFGEAQEKYQYGGNSLFNVFINPAFVSRVRDLPAAREVEQVYAATGRTDIIPNRVQPRITQNGVKIELTNEQISEYQRITGTITLTVYTALAASPKFAELNPATKAQLMAQVLGKSGEAAKLYMFANDPTLVQGFIETKTKQIEAQIEAGLIPK
jgi:hypothetical protein